MSKKVKSKSADKLDFAEFKNCSYTDVNIGDDCMEKMKIFGANNNLMRHFPELRDGLKPGERRVLYTMYLKGLRPDKNHKKVQSITGQTMEIHPHGDAPLHGTLTALGQTWTNQLTMIDGYGNFGTVAGDSAAAGRYIEARLSEFAWDCYFKEFNTDIVDMKYAYDNETKEPEYLPAKYPVAALNSSFGIGYGNYTSICAFNFTELIEVTKKLMDNPKTKDILIYPDSPTGANIIDEGQFQEIIDTGIGKFSMRGDVDIDYEKNTLTIKSVPYLVSTNEIAKKIIELVDDKKLIGIKDIKNHSNKETGIKLEILLKKETDPIVILHKLYSLTDLQQSFAFRMKLIEDYEDLQFNLRTLILEWIDFRRETKRRLWIHKFRKLLEDKHKIEAKLYILEKNRAEKALKIIKSCTTKEESITALKKEFPNITTLQIETIQGLRYGDSTKGYIKELEAELKKLETEDIPKARLTVRSQKIIDKIIKDELNEGVKKFGSERRSKIISIDGELKFRNTAHTLVFSKDGNVKKLPEDIDSIGTFGDGDYVTQLFRAHNADELFVFDSAGNLSKLSVSALENSDLNGTGTPLRNFINIVGSVVTIIPKPNDDDVVDNREKYEDINLMMISRNGIIKKTPLLAFVNMRKTLVSMILNSDDVLQSVKLVKGNKDIVVYTDKGLGVRFQSDDIKESSRMSKGVKTTGDKDGLVVDLEVVDNNEETMLLLTSKGFAKKTPMTTFSTGSRNMKPVKLIGLADDDSLAVLKTIRGDEKFKVILKSSIEIIDCSALSELPRLSKGKKAIPVRKGESIQHIELER